MSATSNHRRETIFKRLPGHLLIPFSIIPETVISNGVATCCNQLFQAALAKGEFDFLNGKVVRILLDDASVTFALTCSGKSLRAAPSGCQADVTIRGSTYEFVALASRSVDPDTLFFHRRLRIEGNTELGLNLKNFLDAWEPPQDIRRIQDLVHAGLGYAERISQRFTARTECTGPLPDAPNLPGLSNTHRRDR